MIAAQNTNKKFRPFEMAGCVASLDDDETEEERKAISVQKFTSNVTMVACELKDDKTQALYEKMNTGGGSSSNTRTEKQLAFERSSFSQRLQTENPFEDFRRAVEDAVIAKSKRPKKVFQPDQAFYKEHLKCHADYKSGSAYEFFKVLKRDMRSYPMKRLGGQLSLARPDIRKFVRPVMDNKKIERYKRPHVFMQRLVTEIER